MLSAKLRHVDALLVKLQWLWQPMPYKEAMPSWVEQSPALASYVANLREAELVALMGDWQAALRCIGQYEAGVNELASILAIDDQTDALATDNVALQWEVPGRKWQQINAFVAALGPVQGEVVEWCGGKGHLGRVVSHQWHTPVHTLEFVTSLCEQGQQLANRVHASQQFYVHDVLKEDNKAILNNRHALALHACGELHRTLLRDAVSVGAPALSVCPCCYHLGCGGDYQAFNIDLTLNLTRDDVRLAVTETVTSSQREQRQQTQEMAWKLAFDELQRDLLGLGYRSIKPIPKAWLKEGFEQFCRLLAQREGIVIPEGVDWVGYELRGETRQQQFLRYNLVRISFRRAIELWLVLDMAVYLEQHGYDVDLKQICATAITPRNILIGAKKRHAVGGDGIPEEVHD